MEFSCGLDDLIKFLLQVVIDFCLSQQAVDLEYTLSTVRWSQQNLARSIVNIHLAGFPKNIVNLFFARVSCQLPFLKQLSIRLGELKKSGKECWYVIVPGQPHSRDSFYDFQLSSILLHTCNQALIAFQPQDEGGDKFGKKDEQSKIKKKINVQFGFEPWDCGLERAINNALHLLFVCK